MNGKSDAKANENNKYQWTDIANKIANDTDCDLLIYTGDIEKPNDYFLLEECKKRKKRKNVNLYLVTFGGEPDAAFRIARFLQSNYERFTVTIPGNCKSAGTLIVIGANEVVMSDNGELGPLDIQLKKPDELFERMSGQIFEDSLSKLQENTLKSFEKYFLTLIKKSDGGITTKTATALAKELVVGLYGNIYNHIDPVSLGEVTRAMNIAIHYGRILNEEGQNIKKTPDEDYIVNLAKDYPHHGFVIDRKQAEEMFVNIRKSNPDEDELIKQIGNCAVSPSGKPIVTWLSNEAPEIKKEDQNDKP